MFKNLRNYDTTPGVKSARLAVLPDPRLKVMLHSTIVFEEFKDTAIIRTGGRDTQSTRIAINRAFQLLNPPHHVYRLKHITYIHGANGASMELKPVMRVRESFT